VSLTAELMERRGKEQDSSQGMGVRHLTGQGERRLTPLQGLLRIAQPPQHPGRKREAKDSGVVQDGMGAVLLGIIEGTALCQVLLRQNKLSEVLKRLSERPMRLHEECRVAGALGQAEEPLPQLACRLVLSPDAIKRPPSHQGHEELWRLSDLSTQRERLSINGFHFRSRIAPGGHQGRAQGRLQEPLILDALGSI
jgi:hypothetical protein